MSESNARPVDAISAAHGDGGADVEDARLLTADEMVATAVDAGADVDLDGEAGGDVGGGSVEVAGDGRTQGVDRLEREGDIAADYLEELLDIADFDGDIDLDVENDRAMVSILGTGLGNLVGQRGATLDALQDLTRLAVLRATGERSRLMLDIAGTRARRKEQLHQVGTEAAERARSDGEPVRMDPMTPFERKVVHDAVAAAGLRSESDGVEPNRRVVVYPS
ncbi:MAG: R3H domain-containing nucleic acid-binding protein [Actinomycetes bacterium]